MVQDSHGTLTLGLGHPAQQGRIGREQGADHLAGRQSRQRPKPEIRPKHGIDSKSLQPGEDHRIAVRQVCGGHQQPKVRTPVRMPKREFRRCQRPRRATHHRQALDGQMVQKLDQRVGLMGRRGIVGKGATQIAKARRRDDPEPATANSGGKKQTLIEAAASAVDHHQGRAVPGHGIFKRTGARLDQGALSKKPVFGLKAGFAESAHGIGAACKCQTTQTKKQIPPRCHSGPSFRL